MKICVVRVLGPADANVTAPRSLCELVTGIVRDRGAQPLLRDLRNALIPNWTTKLGDDAEELGAVEEA